MSGGLTKQVRRIGNGQPPRPSQEPAPIDLSRLDPAIWHVIAGSAVHGPFTLGQLQQFVIAGRLNAASRVAGGAGQAFRPIRERPDLAAALAGAFAERARRRAEAANFLIIARAPAPAEAALWRDMPGCLDALGKHVQAMPGTWILRSGQPLTAIRETLAAALPRTAQIMVLETREARLGWVNFEEDMAEAVSPVWNAALS